MGILEKLGAFTEVQEVVDVSEVMSFVEGNVAGNAAAVTSKFAGHGFCHPFVCSEREAEPWVRDQL